MNLSDIYRLGVLVKKHLHAVAYMQFAELCRDKKVEFSDEEVLFEALLNICTGYTRAYLHHKFDNQQLMLDIDEKSYFMEPITSPVILNNALESLKTLNINRIRSYLKNGEYNDIYQCAIFTLHCFHAMERNSKQQKLPGVSIRVSELVPAIKELIGDGPR